MPPGRGFETRPGHRFARRPCGPRVALENFHLFRAPTSLKIPGWMYALLALIPIVVALGVADKLFWHRGWFQAANLIVLGATLAAVVVYVLAVLPGGFAVSIPF